jgi:hypothetical protein
MKSNPGGESQAAMGVFILSLQGPSENFENLAEGLLGMPWPVYDGKLPYRDGMENYLPKADQLKIVAIQLPPTVSNFEFVLGDWSVDYLEGYDEEFLGIEFSGSFVESIEIPDNFHLQTCPDFPNEQAEYKECEADCWNQEWLRIASAAWQEFYVDLSLEGRDGIGFTAWLKDYPD